MKIVISVAVALGVFLLLTGVRKLCRVWLQNRADKPEKFKDYTMGE